MLLKSFTTPENNIAISSCPGISADKLIIKKAGCEYSVPEYMVLEDISDKGMKCIDHYKSPLGNITISGEDGKLTGLWFDGQKYDRYLIKKAETAETELPVFVQTKKWLDIYFSGKEPDFTPPLKLSGSDFRIMVGEIMMKIPYGQTVTYGEIAKEAAARCGRERMSAQAVGGAVGHNPISIIVPCHRVVGAGGSLTGYAGGVWRKMLLLELEGHNLPDLYED